MRREQSRQPRRIAMLSVHTSPLEQPGTGDAGGMNVYIAQTARRMAQRGIAVEVFTRATSSDLPPQLCAFTAGVLRAEARHEPGHYDLIHSHYWLSGQVGWLARERWACRW